MKLAIVGSRYFIDYEIFTKALNKILNEWKDDIELVISGGAKGADTLAEKWAHEHKIEIMIFPADWKRYGRAAGPIRNTKIINESTHLIAFAAISSKGTLDTINKAKAKGLKIRIVHI
jgi:hypothetical protein